MDDREKLAFESARDTAKQFIVLASGITALMITFAKDFSGGSVSDCAQSLALTSWGLYLFSVMFGLATLVSLTGTVSVQGTSIYDTKVRVFAAIQITSFFFGLCLTVGYGVAA